MAQLPVKCQADDAEGGVDVDARADSAGATHGFVNAIVAKGMEFSIGFDVTEAVRLAILRVPKNAWAEPMGQDMEPREGAGVAEITGFVDLSAWPAGTRAVCRREQPHPGAQCTIFEAEGWRHQVFITNSADADIVYLEVRHRRHAHVEDRIKTAKALGLDHFPSNDFETNAAWLIAVLIACDLTYWTQRLCLTGAMASRKSCAGRCGTPPGRSPPPGAARPCISTAHGRGPPPCKKASTASTPSTSRPTAQPTHPAARPPAAAFNASPNRCSRHPTNKSALLLPPNRPTTVPSELPTAGNPRLESLKVRNSSVNLVTNSRG